MIRQKSNSLSLRTGQMFLFAALSITIMLMAILCRMESFDAFNAVLASLNNLGPALGSVSTNFTQVPDSAKWVMTFAMVCGRLEVFTLLVILSPVFWKD